MIALFPGSCVWPPVSGPKDMRWVWAYSSLVMGGGRDGGGWGGDGGGGYALRFLGLFWEPCFCSCTFKSLFSRQVLNTSVYHMVIMWNNVCISLYKHTTTTNDNVYYRNWSTDHAETDGTHFLFPSGFAADGHCHPGVWCIECNTAVTWRREVPWLSLAAAVSVWGWVWSRRSPSSVSLSCLRIVHIVQFDVITLWEFTVRCL